MKQILLDTNFILSCIRNKLDLFEHLEQEGYEVIVPEQVINEIKKFEKTKPEARVALKIKEEKLTGLNPAKEKRVFLFVTDENVEKAKTINFTLFQKLTDLKRTGAIENF